MHPPPSARSEPIRRPPRAALVRAEAVAKAYMAGGATTRVLRDVDLELAAGESASLVGESGSGKSTLISLLAGILRPDSGQIDFEGQDLAALDDTARARLRAGRIGLVLQSGNLIPFLTARENVELAITLGAGRRPGPRGSELLSELGIAHRGDHLPRLLSGGETQRVALAMALANEPALLLADEVTGELDSSSAEELMRVIFEACRQRGMSVLFATHSDEQAAQAGRRLRLAAGEVRAA